MASRPCVGYALFLLHRHLIRRYPVQSVQMMRSIINEAEAWKASYPELVLPHTPEASSTSEMEGIASAAVHAADSLSEFAHDERGRPSTATSSDITTRSTHIYPKREVVLSNQKDGDEDTSLSYRTFVACQRSL